MPIFGGALPNPLPIAEVGSDPAAVANKSLLFARQLGSRDAVLLSMDGGGGKQILSRYADLTGPQVISGNDIGVQLIEPWVHGGEYEVTWDLTWSSLDASEELTASLVLTPLLNTTQRGSLIEHVRQTGTTTTFHDATVDWPRVVHLVGGTDQASGVLVGVARILLAAPHGTPNFPLSHIQSDVLACDETGLLSTPTRVWMRARGHFAFSGVGTNTPDVRLSFSVGGSVSYTLRSLRIRRVW